MLIPRECVRQPRARPSLAAPRAPAVCGRRCRSSGRTALVARLLVSPKLRPRTVSCSCLIPSGPRHLREGSPGVGGGGQELCAERGRPGVRGEEADPESTRPRSKGCLFRMLLNRCLLPRREKIINWTPLGSKVTAEAHFLPLLSTPFKQLSASFSQITITRQGLFHIHI